jgi:hypothetical protein
MPPRISDADRGDPRARLTVPSGDPRYAIETPRRDLRPSRMKRRAAVEPVIGHLKADH